jgi:single stranded DNA-binding protein
VVPNRSSQTTSARTEAGKQSHFNKEVKDFRPSGGGFRRTPGIQPVTGRPPEAAGGQTPAVSAPCSASQRKGEFGGQRGLNRVNVTGRLGRDAVVRRTKNGRVVANFSIAVDESYKDLLGEWHKKTEWHRVQAWEELAKTVSEDLQKGVRVYVEGRRAFRHWIDRENRKHCYTEIVATDVRFLDPGPKHEARKGSEFNEAYSAALQ